jgi:hypothetical protein
VMCSLQPAPAAHASRVLLGSGVPLVDVPCFQVTES